MASVQEKLEELQARRKCLLEVIQERRQELERIDFAIEVLRSTSGLPDKSGKTLSTTAEGKIRDLAGAITRKLEEVGLVMTCSDLRDALYDSTMAITPEQFRRRLSVKTSAMFKDPGGAQLLDTGLRSPNREIYWGLPGWFNTYGGVDEKRLPYHLVYDA